jgi:ADP-ribosyl-[dinitrogen reductase] hydrolase
MVEQADKYNDTRDRAIGAVIGLAVGDALGTTLEFARRDARPLLAEIVGGGPFRLEAGQWTDDTAMALALAESLHSCRELDETHLMNQFLDWYQTGAYSCNGRCFDIGTTTREALLRFKETGQPVAGSTAENSAGNGSLMRLSPVAVRYFRDRSAMTDTARRQSKVTHGAAEAVDACAVFASLLADALEGKSKDDLLAPRSVIAAPAITEIFGGSWRDKSRNEIQSSGYVVHSLEAAIWSVGNTDSFEEAVILAANLADDADTVAAITGQLAGAIWGVSTIPARWLECLAWRERIEHATERLFDAAITEANRGD